jgi:hypothetical protein
MKAEVRTCACQYGFSIICLGTVCLLSLQATSQQSACAKVCVADINNYTTELLSPARMTARLVKAVADKKLSAVAMDSATGKSTISKDVEIVLEVSTSEQAIALAPGALLGAAVVLLWQWARH